MDADKIARFLGFIVKVFECLQEMDPTTRSRVLGVVEKLSGEQGIAEDIEELVSE